MSSYFRGTARTGRRLRRLSGSGVEAVLGPEREASSRRRRAPSGRGVPLRGGTDLAPDGQARLLTAGDIVGRVAGGGWRTAGGGRRVAGWSRSGIMGPRLMARSMRSGTQAACPPSSSSPARPNATSRPYGAIHAFRNADGASPKRPATSPLGRDHEALLGEAGNLLPLVTRGLPQSSGAQTSRACSRRCHCPAGSCSGPRAGLGRMRRSAPPSRIRRRGTPRQALIGRGSPRRPRRGGRAGGADAGPAASCPARAA